MRAVAPRRFNRGPLSGRRKDRARKTAALTTSKLIERKGGDYDQSAIIARCGHRDVKGFGRVRTIRQQGRVPEAVTRQFVRRSGAANLDEALATAMTSLAPALRQALGKSAPIE